MKEKKSLNTLPLRVNSVLDSSVRDGGVSHAKSDGLMKNDAKSGSLDDHMSLTAEATYDFSVNASSCIDGASSNSQGSLPLDCRASHSSLDDMMNIAYGIKLLYSDGGPRDSA